jgi:hydrogenase expression/formation protein HypE
MPDPLPTLGRIDTSFFGRVVFSRLGAKRDRVVVGPRHGVDIGVVSIGDGKAMAAAIKPGGLP